MYSNFENDIMYYILGAAVLLVLIGLLIFLYLRFSLKSLRENLIKMDNENEADKQDLKIHINNSLIQLLQKMDSDRKDHQQDMESVRSTLLLQLNSNELNQDRKLEIIRSTLDEKVTQLSANTEKKLDEMRHVVDDKLQETLNSRLTQSFKLVSDQLEEVHKGLGEMQNLANGVGDIRKVLSNTKTRGILGEIQLGAILKEVLPSSQYEENVATVPDSKDRVEFAIKLPDATGAFVYLPIDAKFPTESYTRLQDALEQGDKIRAESERKSLADTIKREAKDIASKYVKIPYTTDFAILFLATEGLYAEACNMGLMEILQREYRITLAGPSTMAALLNSLQMGFKTLAISERSEQVWKLLESVKSEFSKFEDTLNKIQSNLESTSRELDNLVGKRTRQITRQLNRMENLDQNYIEEIEPNK